MAEREGFEPSVRLHAQLISSQPHSTTLPPLHTIILQIKNLKNQYDFIDINYLD